MKITIVSAGKPKEPFLSIFKEYTKRSGRFIKIEYLFLKDNKDFETKILNKKKGRLLILLDENGKEYSSKQFADFLIKEEQLGKELLFVIGSTNGHSKELKENADFLISLSRFTFPHEFALAIFSEVLYRSISIKFAHPYHRE